MLRSVLFSLFLSVLSRAFVLEVPLPSGHRGQAARPAVPTDKDDLQWRFEVPPDHNITDHLVFDTVHSLLQHWPNTRMRNGHNIVPGTIPEGTILYHATHVQKLPQGPGWYALHPEHAYYFCRESLLTMGDSGSQSGCWHYTFVTTRPLKIIYFDGSSAAKLPWGTLDTQDFLTWGEIRPQQMWLELTRAEILCRWARNNGVDGFVRMEMAFEILACDFTNGVTITSVANIVHPLTVKPIWARPMLEALAAGSGENLFPGETRIQLDLSGLVSFYDTELVPSLVPVRAGQQRWDHRVGNASLDDVSAVIARLEAILARPEGLSSRIDWRTHFHAIVDRYAERLALTRYLVNSPVPSMQHMLDLAMQTQTQLRVILTPYLLVYAVPKSPADGGDVDWAIPVYKLCATAHTNALYAMTDSERLLLRAVRGTSREICRVVTKMWATGVNAGIDPLLNTKGAPDTDELAHVWRAWSEDMNPLMGWLDWSVWVKCGPECRPEEMCYLPTWPVDFPRFPIPGGSDDRPWWDADIPDSDAWIRPEPTCKSRVENFPW